MYSLRRWTGGFIGMLSGTAVGVLGFYGLREFTCSQQSLVLQVHTGLTSLRRKGWHGPEQLGQE